MKERPGDVLREEFRLNLQKGYELRVARQCKTKEIERAVQPGSAAA